MCKIKNEFTEGLLKDLRKMDKGEVAFSTDKADILARVSFMIESLEAYETVLKAELKDTLKETVLVPSVEKKVVMMEGRSSSVFDNQSVYDMVGADKYIEITSVVKGKLESALGKDNADLVVANCSTTEKGESTVSVRSMTKKELTEAGIR